ncbi:MAG: hypothetical protein K8T10_19040 [Candidatus Eremiobacteraeota bacterium]|nr:hypothetical protein [Candidatus Eremiobacteraeota bacterium]
MANFEVNPNISTLIENAQRANPMLGKKTKDYKKKKVKSGGSLHSSADMDSTDLSEDLLGDMDPDQYKGRDHAAEFKERMKEWVDEDEEEDGQDEHEDQEEEEEPSGQNGIKEEETPPSMEDFQREDEEREESRQDEETARKLSEFKSSGESTDEEKELKDPMSEELDESFGWKNEDIIKESLEVLNEAIAGKGEKKEGEEKEDLSVLEGPSSEFISLLSYNEGFIIADPKRKPDEPKSSDLPITVKEKQIKQEVKRVQPHLNARFKEVFSKLIVSENRGIAYERLSQQLKIFGIRVLETCLTANEKVLLIPIGKSLEDFKSLLSREYDHSIMKLRYGYFPHEKLMILGEDIIINGHPRFKIPVLYFAHVFDHALGDDGFASEKSVAVLSNYNSCLDRKNGHQFIDSYTSISPAHYFAQSVESFLTAPHGMLNNFIAIVDEVLCSKEELYDLDRPMYSYLEYLFRQVNKGDELKTDDDEEEIEHGMI